jgi:hypothetical protein
LGIEVEATCTPRVERKVVAADVTSSSREQASEQLQDLADLSISGKRCERATFCRESHDVDPLPDVPENLLDPLWLIPKINERKAAKGGDSAAQQIANSPTGKTPEALDELADWTLPKDDKHPRWSPEPLTYWKNKAHHGFAPRAIASHRFAI